MRLTSLGLNNFRQFYGQQELFFASDHHRNVTVVHGHNGSGKTALLNAFVWCLYGETTPDLEEGDRLENERALAEADSGSTVHIAVRLSYEEHGTKYIVERTRKVVKESDTSVRRLDPELEIWSIDASGKTQPLGTGNDDRQLRINRLLPKSLYPFFFFNGERVERLARPDAYNDVENGVKTLLDVEVFERTVRHLHGPIMTELSKELKVVGDQETRDVVEQQQMLERQREELLAAIEEERGKAKATADEIALYEAKQGTIAALQELTNRRADLRGQLANVENSLETVNQDLRRVLSADGYLAFAEPVFNATANLVLAARQRGDIPAKIKPQFVDDLMQKGECICGSPWTRGPWRWRRFGRGRRPRDLRLLRRRSRGLRPCWLHCGSDEPTTSYQLTDCSRVGVISCGRKPGSRRHSPSSTSSSEIGIWART